MTDLFDYAESQRRKEVGMGLAAEKKEDFLEIARQIAIRIAKSRENREIHADDVGRALVEAGIDLGPASGSIFKGSEWEFTGKRVRSARKTNHGRELKVWRLKT